MTPRRIRRERTAGWRLPDGAVVVTRPTRWGNPYRVVDNRTLRGGFTRPAGFTVHLEQSGTLVASWAGFTTKSVAADFAVTLYRATLLAGPGVHGDQEAWDYFYAPLTGHDLACFCPLGAPCHADVLLEFANGRHPR